MSMGAASWLFARGFSPGESSSTVDDFSRIVHRRDESAIVLVHPATFEPDGIAAGRSLVDAATAAWSAGASMNDVFALVPPPAKHSYTSLLVIAITRELHVRRTGCVFAWLTDEEVMLAEGTGQAADETDQIWLPKPRARLVCGNYMVQKIEWGPDNIPAHAGGTLEEAANELVAASPEHVQLPTIVVTAERYLHLELV